MIAAHPFRGFKVFGFGQLRMTPEQAAKRRLFQLVDAMEVCNGKLSEEENRMALEVSKILGLAGTGGSDAHQVDEVGKWVTVFDGISGTNRYLWTRSGPGVTRSCAPANLKFIDSIVEKILQFINRATFLEPCGHAESAIEWEARKFEGNSSSREKSIFLRRCCFFSFREIYPHRNGKSFFPHFRKAFRHWHYLSLGRPAGPFHI